MVSDIELESYLDEALPIEEMSRLERQLREDATLVERLAQINRRRDSGSHSLGSVWRRHQLTCPSRSELRGYLLGTLEEEFEDYIDFHLQEVGCRVCNASVEDLKQRGAESSHPSEHRRQKFFQSSAGYLPKQS